VAVFVNVGESVIVDVKVGVYVAEFTGVSVKVVVAVLVKV
jgi:hypothetical protein